MRNPTLPFTQEQIFVKPKFCGALAFGEARVETRYPRMVRGGASYHVMYLNSTQLSIQWRVWNGWAFLQAHCTPKVLQAISRRGEFGLCPSRKPATFFLVGLSLASHVCLLHHLSIPSFPARNIQSSIPVARSLFPIGVAGL